MSTAQEEKNAKRVADNLSSKLGVPVDPAFGHPDFDHPMCWYMRVWCDDDITLPLTYQGMPVVRRNTYH